MNRFTGKYVVVTCGNSSIGRACVQRFVDEDIVINLKCPPYLPAGFARYERTWLR